MIRIKQEEGVHMRKVIVALTVFAAFAAISSPAAARFTDSEAVPPQAATEELPAAGTVPEPASWALMISGFAFVGLALRRQRTVRHTA